MSCTFCMASALYIFHRSIALCTTIEYIISSALKWIYDDTTRDVSPPSRLSMKICCNFFAQHFSPAIMFPQSHCIYTKDKQLINSCQIDTRLERGLSSTVIVASILCGLMFYCPAYAIANHLLLSAIPLCAVSTAFASMRDGTHVASSMYNIRISNTSRNCFSNYT